MTDSSYEALCRAGVLRVRRPGTEWLSTGWNGGRWRTDCAYNVSVPEGWSRTDLGPYVDERLERAGFDDGTSRAEGPDRRTDTGRRSDAESERRLHGGDDRTSDAPAPALLTGVEQEDARGARHGSVTAYATAGISNPAALPMEPSGEAGAEGSRGDDSSLYPRGTVNVIVGTTRALAPGALANLVAVAAEAKAATLLAETGVPGTTTDAIVAGHDPSGERAAFSGSGTDVGRAARACVREAVRASLEAHYDGREETLPVSVDDAAYGVSTDCQATVFRPAHEDR